ncbi:MAG: hypothetical protein M0T71_08085 [Actinomycetota bacterium]|nr:hypothetical protein [Actinomycetota bacterium]
MTLVRPLAGDRLPCRYGTVRVRPSTARSEERRHPQGAGRLPFRHAWRRIATHRGMAVERCGARRRSIMPITAAH